MWQYPPLIITLLLTFAVGFAVGSWNFFPKDTESKDGKRFSDRIRIEQQANNVRILEAANTKLVQHLKSLYSPGGPISKLISTSPNLKYAKLSFGRWRVCCKRRNQNLSSSNMDRQDFSLRTVNGPTPPPNVEKKTGCDG